MVMTVVIIAFVPQRAAPVRGPEWRPQRSAHLQRPRRPDPLHAVRARRYRGRGRRAAATRRPLLAFVLLAALIGVLLVLVARDTPSDDSADIAAPAERRNRAPGHAFLSSRGRFRFSPGIASAQRRRKSCATTFGTPPARPSDCGAGASGGLPVLLDAGGAHAAGAGNTPRADRALPRSGLRLPVRLGRRSVVVDHRFRERSRGRSPREERGDDAARGSARRDSGRCGGGRNAGWAYLPLTMGSRPACSA